MDFVIKIKALPQLPFALIGTDNRAKHQSRVIHQLVYRYLHLAPLDRYVTVYTPWLSCSRGEVDWRRRGRRSNRTRGAGGGGAIFARMHLFMNERIKEGRNDIVFSGRGDLPPPPLYRYVLETYHASGAIIDAWFFFGKNESCRFTRDLFSHNLLGHGWETLDQRSYDRV